MEAIWDENLGHHTLLLVGELGAILSVAVWPRYLVHIFKPIGTEVLKLLSKHFYLLGQPIGTGIDRHARGVKALGIQDLLPLRPRYPAGEINL